MRGVVPGIVVRRRWLWWGMRLPKRDVLRFQLVLSRMITGQHCPRPRKVVSVVDLNFLVPLPERCFQMTYQWDELSKALADDSLPRRQSLRWLGAALAGAVLSPFGLGEAWAGKKQDPCEAFCNRCSNKTQQNQCLAACQACNGNTARLGGSCGKYVCCSTASCSGVCSDLRSDPNCGACGSNCRVYGESCCGNYCADLANDAENCGKCGTRCNLTGPYEYGACVRGACV